MSSVSHGERRVSRESTREERESLLGTVALLAEATVGIIGAVSYGGVIMVGAEKFLNFASVMVAPLGALFAGCIALYGAMSYIKDGRPSTLSSLGTYRDSNAHFKEVDPFTDGTSSGKIVESAQPHEVALMRGKEENG